jgi:protein phosphatase
MTDRVVIQLRDPALVILLGAGGAGKSTFARRHFAADEILSSDAYRGHVSGDTADQGASRAAFAALHDALARRLAEGRLAVVDATNVRAHARAALVRRARSAGVPVVAIALDLPHEVVLSRNAGRSGGAVVPEDAVLAQLGHLAEALQPGRLAGEGVTHLVRLRDPGEVDRVAIERVGAAAPEPAEPVRTDPGARAES